jgi:cobalt/nickel transport protein
MRNSAIAGLGMVLIVCLMANRAEPHFQVLLPSADVVAAADGKVLNLDILFTHPMQQGPVMAMGTPRQFGLLLDGMKRDLAKQLKLRKVDGKAAYTAAVEVQSPGDYIFFLEPAPYWEPAEKKMIVHYAKVVVDVLGAEEGWDALVGFPIEIQPLSRPFGLWTGNAFRGIVKKDGKPLPFATVEVEYYNAGKRVRIPNDALVTQVVKADAAGVFSYTMPKAGWWGFAALARGDQRVSSPSGQPVDVELGGVMWVKTVDMESDR